MELALVLPVIVLLLFGIIEFGRGYNAKVELTAAVREGARAATLSSGDPVAATRTAAPGLTPGSIGVTVVTPCPPIGSGNASVRATYPFQYSIPFFGSRPVRLDRAGPEAAVATFDAAALRPGQHLAGPALIDGPDTTIWLPAGMNARVEADRTVIIEVDR